MGLFDRERGALSDAVVALKETSADLKAEITALTRQRDWTKQERQLREEIETLRIEKGRTSVSLSSRGIIMGPDMFVSGSAAISTGGVRYGGSNTVIGPYTVWNGSTTVLNDGSSPFVYSLDPLMKKLRNDFESVKLTLKPVEAETDPLVWLRRRVDEICWQPPSR